jgi:hypothetical protein
VGINFHYQTNDGSRHHVSNGACWAVSNWFAGCYVPSYTPGTAGPYAIFDKITQIEYHPKACSVGLYPSCGLGALEGISNYHLWCADYEAFGPRTVRWFSGMIKFYRASRIAYLTPDNTFVLKCRKKWAKAEAFAILSAARLYEEHPIVLGIHWWLDEIHPTMPWHHKYYMALHMSDSGHRPASHAVLQDYWKNGLPRRPKRENNLLESIRGSDSEYTCGVKRCYLASPSIPGVQVSTNDLCALFVREPEDGRCSVSRIRHISGFDYKRYSKLSRRFK